MRPGSLLFAPPSSLLLTLLAPLLLAACTDRAVVPGPGVPIDVTSVHDADTLRGVVDGEELRVRFLAVDAPEIGQAPWGVRARDYLRELLAGRDVRLETDVEATDRYGRTLGWIWVRDGNDWELVNERLVREGYAFAYVFRDDARYADRIERAEQEAQEERVNIWDPRRGLDQRPDEYRRR